MKRLVVFNPYKYHMRKDLSGLYFEYTFFNEVDLLDYNTEGTLFYRCSFKPNNLDLSGSKQKIGSLQIENLSDVDLQEQQRLAQDYYDEVSEEYEFDTLSFSYFYGANLYISDTNANTLYFQNCILTGSKFCDYVTLDNPSFAATNLSKSTFEHTDILSASFNYCSLESSIFKNSLFGDHTNFDDCSLRNATFENIGLSKEGMEDAVDKEMGGSGFYASCTFSKCDLINTSFSNIDIPFYFEDCIYNEGTVFPKGIDQEMLEKNGNVKVD